MTMRTIWSLVYGAAFLSGPVFRHGALAQDNANFRLDEQNILDDPLETIAHASEPYCVSNKHYTTQAGDTCESIAKANGVSAADLYMGNQELVPDCQNVQPGVTVCIPLACQTHYIKPGDTCTSIELASGLRFGKLRWYNAWLDPVCRNLQSATDFYGKVICVSPQGGRFTGRTPASLQKELGYKDGYSRDLTTPPEEAIVADGTTLKCGRWHEVTERDSCASICVRHTITTKLFHDVNPSLGPGMECSGTLEVGTTLCVGPTYGWNYSKSEL